MRHQGYATTFSPDAPIVERDTTSCGHCQKVIFLKPGSGVTVYLIPHRDGRWTEESGAFCRVCMRPICLPCHDKGTCTPFEVQIERMEKR